MSATPQQPPAVPRPGQRVVLVTPRADTGSAPQRLRTTLDEIARLGWIIAAIIDPSQQMDALRMVVDGLADVVVAASPEHLSVLKFAYDLGSPGRAGSGHTGYPPAGNQRRPRPVRQLVDDEPDTLTPPNGRYRQQRAQAVQRSA